MARLTTLLVITIYGVLAVSACVGEANRGEPSTSGQDETSSVCDGRLPKSDAEVRDSVVVNDGRAPCELEFREISRLAGSVEGRIPRPPIGLGPNGGYLSATYNRGEIAIWSAKGELERIIGRGEGSGPGEFGLPRDLVVGPDSIVNVMTGRQHWHRYAMRGEFIETVSIPTTAGAGRAVAMSDGTLVTAVRSWRGPLLLAWRGHEVEEIGPPAQFVNQSLVFDASSTGGLWSAESKSYVVRRHALPGGEVQFRIRRSVDWFPGSGEIPGNLYGLAVDDHGRLWITVGIEDPDAPPGLPTVITDPGERGEILDRYRDTRIEVLSMDGRLIASRLYKEARFIPTAITGDRWYRGETNDDLLEALVILEPILDPR